MERYNVEMLSTGDLLRAEVRAQTDLGKEAESIMASGGILDDAVVLSIVEKKLRQLRDQGTQVRTCAAAAPEPSSTSQIHHRIKS